MPPDEYAPSSAFGPPEPPSACCIVLPLTLVVPSAKTSYGAVPLPTKSTLPKLFPSWVYCVHWPGEIPEAVVVAGGGLTVGLAGLEVVVVGVVVVGVVVAVVVAVVAPFDDVAVGIGATVPVEVGSCPDALTPAAWVPN